MKKPRAILFTILIGVIVVLAGFTSRVWMASGSIPAAVVQTSQSIPFTPRQSPGRHGLLRRESIPSSLQQALQTMGDRLEVKGKERTTISGTLKSAGSSQATAFSLVAELPKRLRLTLNNGTGNRVVVTDGASIRANGTLNQRDYDLIETLIYDTTEHLLLEQETGSLAMRYLGGRFRNSEKLTETPFDIFGTSEVIIIGESSREQTKHYCFNSDTWLLEQVTYERTVNNLESKVEIQMSNWQLIDGQKVATTIERFENKASIFKVTFNSVQFSQQVNDGIFQ
jgi:hypothetical protein